MEVFEIIVYGVIILLLLRLVWVYSAVPAPVEAKILATRLWLEHVWWTRAFIMESASKRPTDQIVERLMTNQSQLANGNIQLHSLLQQHIQIAATLVGQLIANVRNEVSNQTISLWRDNANQIADQLGISRGMMQDHLNATIDETKKILGGDFQAVKEIDNVTDQIMHMVYV